MTGLLPLLLILFFPAGQKVWLLSIPGHQEMLTFLTHA